MASRTSSSSPLESTISVVESGSSCLMCGDWTQADTEDSGEVQHTEGLVWLVWFGHEDERERAGDWRLVSE